MSGKYIKRLKICHRYESEISNIYTLSSIKKYQRINLKDLILINFLKFLQQQIIIEENVIKKIYLMEFIYVLYKKKLFLCLKKKIR